MKKLHMAEISVAVGLIIAIVVSIAGFGAECKNIRQDVVRLHILANSDSDEDQQVKLLVRDVLLNCGKDLFSGAVTAENAGQCLELQKDELIKEANRVLADNGFDYKTDIYLAEEYFSTRAYEDFTLPAGEYLALKVILGEGEGHNWWCVMFPPLCLPAAGEKADLDAVFGEEGAKIVQTESKYVMRFKIVEIFENLKNKIKSSSF